VQGYFVYDSKKAGATTVSHLRTSPRPIRSAYLISKARFVACHQFEFLERVDVLEHAVEGAVFLLNAPYAADEVWEWLPREVQEQLIDKRIRFYTIDASAVTADGTCTSCKRASVASTASKLRFTTSAPRLL
jgi:pyruvate-ferredoxin/flavodoxin oxidoreductase